MTNCRPTILGNSTLMTDEGEFMLKSDIKERCECIYKSVCLQIVDLLDNGKYEVALDNIPDTRPKEREREGKEKLRQKIQEAKELVEELEMDLEINAYPNERQSLLRTIDYQRKVVKAYERERKQLLSGI